MNPNINFKFAVKELIVKGSFGRSERYVNIVLTDKRDGFFVIHPVSVFIRTRNNVLTQSNTAIIQAESVKRFLNWLLIDNYETYQMKSFEHLQFKHGADFIKSRLHLNRKTVSADLSYIVKFYTWLNREGVCSLCGNNENTGNFIKYQLIEAGALLPERNLQVSNLTDFPGEYKYDESKRDLVRLFIETADDVEPMIAIGIYFQFFGGFRRGEVVNTTPDSIEVRGAYGKDGLLVEIKDRDYLFARLKNNSKNEVKSPRKQPIFTTQLLPKLYKNHMDLLLKNKSRDVNAFFIDKDGNAMSGAVYEKKFKHVKQEFFKRLQKAKNTAVYAYLAKTPWETHIGRGIFTNIVAPYCKTPYELALLRGDRSLDAAMEYMSLQRVEKEIERGLETFWTKEKQGYKERYEDTDSEISNEDRLKAAASIKLEF